MTAKRWILIVGVAVFVTVGSLVYYATRPIADENALPLVGKPAPSSSIPRGEGTIANRTSKSHPPLEREIDAVFQGMLDELDAMSAEASKVEASQVTDDSLPGGEPPDQGSSKAPITQEILKKRLEELTRLRDQRQAVYRAKLEAFVETSKILPDLTKRWMALIKERDSYSRNSIRWEELDAEAKPVYQEMKEAEATWLAVGDQLLADAKEAKAQLNAVKAEIEEVQAAIESGE